MPENNSKNNENLVDLSELSNLQFKTAWTPSSTFNISEERQFKQRNGKKHFSKRPFGKNSDAKKQFAPKKEGDDSKKHFKRKPFGKFGKPQDKKRPNAPFNFTMDVQIFPEDAPFAKIAEIIKTSKRTYQLFDVARLILEKNERMVILAKNLPDSDNIVKPLFCAQPLNIPFEDEQSAKNAAIEYYFKQMFDAEEIDAEPPKGAFTVVNKCSLSGDLLGAPNWHKYNEFVREYHKGKYPKMPFEAFLETIESVKGEENINAWLEQMKKRTVYKLKEPQEGEEAVFETSDAAKNYIAQKKADELVRVYEQARLNAANIEFMPYGRIRRNIEETIRREKRFPMATANNMRGKLRRGGFAVYKRGSKGFAFVSTIKRKFLLEGESLADAPQKIFDFLLLNPAIKIAEFPYKFLGIEAPKPAAEAASKPAPEANAEAQNAQAEPQAAPQAEPAPEAQAEAGVAESAKAAEILDDETKSRINSALGELGWLISEGYVVEYSDTTLQANPYLPKPKDKSQPAPDGEGAPDDEPVAAAQPAESVEEESGEEAHAEEPQPSEGEETPAEAEAAQEQPSESGEENAPQPQA